MKPVEWVTIPSRLLASPRTRAATVVGLFLLGSVLAFHRLFLPFGGRFYDGDFVTPTTPADLRYYLAAFSGPWNSGTIVFGFNPFFPNNLILLTIVGAFSLLFGSLGTGMLATLVAVEAGLGLSLYLSARRMGVAPPWAIVAGLASMLSPAVFDRSVAGHEIILAAAMFVPPFLVLLSEATSHAVGVRHAVVLGGLWGVVGLLEYHMFYLVGIVWLVGFAAAAFRTLVRPSPERWGARLRVAARRLGGLLGAVVVAVGANLAWLVSAVTFGGGSQQLSTSTATSLGILTYTQGAIRQWTLFASNVYWGQQWTSTWGRADGFALGIVVSYALSLVFLAVLFWHAYHRRAETDTLVLVALVLIVLSTGTILPGGLYLFLLHNVPAFAVNDDPAKFDVVLTPCLALLLGSALQGWWRAGHTSVSESSPGRILRWRRAGHRVARVAVFAAIAVVVVSAAPFATGNFGGRVAHVPDAPGALATANSLDGSVPPLGRVALFPPDPTEYVGKGQSPANPLAVYPPGSAIYIPGPPGIEPLNLATQTATWAYTAMYANATDHGASLFGLMDATSWVVDRAAMQSPAFGPYDWDNPYALSLALDTQVDLGPSVTNEQTRIYSTGNSTAGPVSLQNEPTLALADREFLLDAAYLPNGDAWVRSTPFVLDSGTLSGNLSASNSSAPYIETPEGILDEEFSQLPAGSVVPTEPIVWAGFGAGGLPPPGHWTPWEQHYDLENGRPLASLLGFGTTNNELLPLTVPLPTVGGPRSEVWADMFYGPSEGSLQADLGSRPPVTINAFAAFPSGFHWTPVALLGNASSAAFWHVGSGWTSISAVAVVPPGALSSALNATGHWLASNGAAVTNPPVLWVKGDAGTGYGTWTRVGTGGLAAEGWGSVVNPDGAFTTTFYLPEAASVGVLARASGSGSVYVSACPGTSLTDSSLEPCTQHTLVSFDSTAPAWSEGASNLSVGPGIVKVTIYGAARSVLLDQLILTPSAGSLLAGCATPMPGEWTCATSAKPVSVSGNVGGPQLGATFAAAMAPSVLVHLVSCDVPWRASGSGVAAVPFVVDGWACGYVAAPGTSTIGISIPGLVASAEAGLAGSILVAVPAAFLAILGVAPLRRILRRARRLGS
ncbi:MAG: hypothetical protein L3K18_09285 [Thermoplasmata archaeon]|nr:hypothetical protein [Thermoplasmata archaeon]